MSYINRIPTHLLLMKPKPVQLKSKTSKEYRQVILVIIHKTIDQKQKIIFYLPNFLIFFNINRAHIQILIKPFSSENLEFSLFSVRQQKNIEYLFLYDIYLIEIIFCHHNCNGFIIYLASLLTSALNRSCLASYI